MAELAPVAHQDSLGSEQRTSARHALSGHLYEALEPGHVRVVDEKTGLSGIFRASGEWMSGDLKRADPFFCGWLDHKSREVVYRNPLAGA